MEVCDYRRVNESFRKRLVYHAGIDCGFFVELNYMVNAMLHCLANGYRFQLYSEDANFGTGKGWTEYFMPFCEEVRESFHHKYNCHRPPTWRRILRHTIQVTPFLPMVATPTTARFRHVMLHGQNAYLRIL